MTLPSTALQKFISTTNAFSDNSTSTDGSLRLPPTFSASMTITLSSGLSLTFPPSWLSNISNLTPISSVPSSNPGTSNTTTPSSAGPILGAAFLSHIYLMVDYTTSQFYLSPANLNAPFITLTPWCPGSVPKPFKNPKLSSFAKAGLPGVIIGGLLGGSAISLCAVLVTRWFLRRERERKRVRFIMDDEGKDGKGGWGGSFDDGDEVEEEDVGGVITGLGPDGRGGGAVRMMTFDPPPKVATVVSVRDVEVGEGSRGKGKKKEKFWGKGGGKVRF